MSEKGLTRNTVGNSRLKCWGNEEKNIDKMEQFMVHLNEKKWPSKLAHAADIFEAEFLKSKCKAKQ